MPRSLNLSKYPSWMFDLLTLQLPFALELPSKREAMRLRFQIWGFRDALAASRHPGAAALDAMLLRIDDNKLLLEPRDTTDQHIIDQLRTAAKAEAPLVANYDTTPPKPYASTHMESAVEKWLREGREKPIANPLDTSKSKG